MPEPSLSPQQGSKARFDQKRRDQGGFSSSVALICSSSHDTLSPSSASCVSLDGASRKKENRACSESPSDLPTLASQVDSTFGRDCPGLGAFPESGSAEGTTNDTRTK